MASSDVGSRLALIVGLGNPGREYAATRHNLGWVLLDDLIGRATGVGAAKKKFQGEVCRGDLAGRACIFLRPQTFMNESGRSAQAAAAFFRVPPRDIVVLHDELDLSFGEVRAKIGGGHAGHNGLFSLVQHLATPDFVRVRMGIGRPPAEFAGGVAGYVLAGFSPEEVAGLPAIIERGASALLRTLTDDFRAKKPFS